MPREYVPRQFGGNPGMEAALARLVPRTASAAPVNAVAATRVLTMDTQPTANDTITIGTTVYTWKTSGAVAGEINRGADLAAAKLNLVAAINGTDSINTAHALVSAAAFVSNAMTITARTKGTAANAIATTETFTAGTNVWAGATMTGGVNGTYPGSNFAGPYEMLFHGGYLYINVSDLAEEKVTVDSWYRVQFSVV